MRRPRWVHGLAVAVLALMAGGGANARVIPIPVDSRVGPPRSDPADGLDVRFRDVGLNEGCTLAFCAAATDTVTVQITTMPNINYLLNTGSTFGPFNFGDSFFETRWDSYLDIKTAGDYIFSMQVDDGASVAIGDSLILALDGGHWFTNATSDTVQFDYAGMYPFRAYFFDCPVCCRGFRFGGMGPAGSGMMAFTPGFDFNADLGPCCTYGSNGPGNSVVPASLFYRSRSITGVGPEAADPGPGTIVRCWASPNPFHGMVVIAADLAAEQRVWAGVFDASGRRVATLSDGASYPRGTVRWAWSPDWSRVGKPTAGAYFYRMRTEDGSTASGRMVRLE